MIYCRTSECCTSSCKINSVVASHLSTEAAYSLVTLLPSAAIDELYAVSKTLKGRLKKDSKYAPTRMITN